MSTLNQFQKHAVETLFGKILVLAGAGSGKTRVLVERILYILEKGYPPESILGLTFTNKAAEEMKERIASAIGKERASKVLLCTFHSFCMKILRDQIHHLGYTKHFSLYDESDVLRVVKTLTRDILGLEKELPSLGETWKKLQSMQNEVTLPIQKNQIWHDKFTLELYSRLQTSLRAYNAIDFDSLLKLTCQLFQKYPDVAKIYQDRFQFILIDEYQDTNPIQYEIANILSSVHGNLFVVGDDDQSIYGWRGARVECILDFPADITIKLEQNYRSTPTILKAANSVICKNDKRHQKELFSNQDIGEKIEVFHAPTEDEEAEAIVYRILMFKEKYALSWKDFAILYRSNALSRSIEKALLNAYYPEKGDFTRGIPYRIYGGIEMSERSEVKDFFAFARVVVNPLDHEALLRIINTPRRGISDECLDKLTQYQRSVGGSLFDLLVSITNGTPPPVSLSKKAIEGIRSLTTTLLQAQKSTLPPDTLLLELLEKLNYKKAIEEEVKSDQMRAFKWENILGCIESLKKFIGDGRGDLADFIHSRTLDTHHQEETAGDTVSLLTFHSAKGLEFPVCFLAGTEDHIIPHEKSVQDRGLEEERRLMYVAITRAKKKLVISMSQFRNRRGKKEPSSPSRFLFDIPKEILHITDWQGMYLDAAKV